MKSSLILGLGNSLMGDDGIGGKVAELLSIDPRLPPNVHVFCGGTDLLRWADQMEGCERVLLVDAILGNGSVGSVEIFADDFSELEDRQWNVHHLSVRQAIGLLQASSPGLRNVRFILIAVNIASVETHEGLSSELSASLPGIVESVLQACREPALG
jgi:hydrogenase maturation protease